MSLLNDASLVMVPSGYKDTKLYSVKPTNGDGDFTFSRGSNLAATRVNSEGLIEKGRENLLLQSNTFDTTWTTTNASVTGGQSGYDGLNNAWELKENTSTGVHEIIQTLSVSASVQTYSLKVSANTRSKMALVLAGSAFNSGGNGIGIFNLTNGTLISSSGSLIDAKITSLGGNWYNVSITKLATSSSAVAVVQLVDDSNNTSYTGNGTGSIYIQDAQAEQGLVATDYIETTTTTAQAGILEDMPRLDYSGGASCGHLLLEPQRSNLVTNSEYFGGYTNFGSADTANQETSPEGVVNATLIEGDGLYNQIYTGTPIITVPSAGDYTLSIFAKKGTEQYIRLYLDGFTGSSNNSAYFDLDNGTTPTSGASIEDYGNGWYRCYITATIDAGDLTGRLAFNVTPSTSTVFYGSAAAANGKNIYTYGAMLEAGSYSTSLIPTYGSSVTRSADVANDLSAADLIGNNEGVIFIDIKTPSAIQSNTTFSIGGGTTSEYAQLEIRTDLTINWRYRVGGTDYINANVGSYVAGDRLKIAFAYKNGDSILYKNGSSIATDTGTIGINAWDEVRFSNFAGTGNLNANVNQTLLFKTRLTNDELAALTTI